MTTIDPRGIKQPAADVDEPRRPTLPRPVYRPQYFPGWGPKL